MKDMQKVSDYAMEDKLKFLRGMCFNNSSVLLAGSFSADVKIVTAKAVFNFAEALFDEAIARDYLNYGKNEDKRMINKETGKVAETPSSAVGGVPVTLTNEDVAKMEIGQDEPQDLVI